ncbi:hypothetical protein GCM10017673_33070 [Streptosporangium violaceochromogenes]|nr:hypothetical protein GCM10017673_33070 [Streptosporangium violaceochromogenes]
MKSVSLVPTGAPRPPRRGLGVAARSLRYASRRRAAPALRRRGGSGATLSVPTDFAVWWRNGFFIWNDKRRETSRPADDPAGEAHLLSPRHRRPRPGDDLSREGTGPRADAPPPTDAPRD